MNDSPADIEESAEAAATRFARELTAARMDGDNLNRIIDDICEAIDGEPMDGDRGDVVVAVRALVAERDAFRDALMPSSATKAAYIGEVGEGNVSWREIKVVMYLIRERAGRSTLRALSG